jgi:hypothetical protein
MDDIESEIESTKREGQNIEGRQKRSLPLWQRT